MVLMYWREKLPLLDWKLNDDFNSDEWNAAYSLALSKINPDHGMSFNRIKRFLRSLDTPVSPRLEFLRDMQQLDRLIGIDVPPIPLFDRFFMLRGIKKTPYHAVVLVDYTQEIFTAVDPFLSPRYVIGLPKRDFKDAWNLIQGATIIISPKTISFRRRKLATMTLERWFTD